MNADASYENGYAWAYDGVVPPDYGAFAEKYFTPNFVVCSIVLDLTTVGDNPDTADLYVWEDQNGAPGAVLATMTGYSPGAIAFWPSVSRHVASIDLHCESVPVTWIGYWGNWPGRDPAWFVGADLDGFGGFPFANIAPGIGYPTGWNNVSVVWGPTQALGIGAEFDVCETPTRTMTWGAIKGLFE